MDVAFKEFNNYRALHEAVCVELDEENERVMALKRKADDANDRTEPTGKGTGVRLKGLCRQKTS